MSSKTLKLAIPNDIGEEEIFINHRQKLIEERLLKTPALIITSFFVKKTAMATRLSDNIPA